MGEGLDCGSEKHQAAKNLELYNWKKQIKIKIKSENQGPTVVANVANKEPGK